MSIVCVWFLTLVVKLRNLKYLYTLTYSSASLVRTWLALLCLLWSKWICLVVAKTFLIFYFVSFELVWSKFRRVLFFLLFFCVIRCAIAHVTEHWLAIYLCIILKCAQLLVWRSWLSNILQNYRLYLISRPLIGSLFSYFWVGLNIWTAALRCPWLPFLVAKLRRGLLIWVWWVIC